MAEPSDLIGEIVEVATEHRDSLTDARRKREKTRRAEALALKLAGLTYAQIGDRLQISERGAHDLVQRTIERAENRAAAQERALENLRLDRAQMAIWPQVVAGDLKAVDTYLRLSARRAKLNGLDVPVDVHLSISVRQEMESALAQLEQVVLGGPDTVMGEVIEAHDDVTLPDGAGGSREAAGDTGPAA